MTLNYVVRLGFLLYLFLFSVIVCLIIIIRIASSLVGACSTPLQVDGFSIAICPSLLTSFLVATENNAQETFDDYYYHNLLYGLGG
ncbi:hypothetical protein VNO77_17360 [Canavalia gladiata]|uniref:Uncharacterized protein n=1 Tax=Canavalia gladiata TaxID=3824 RepID=A0AAN9QIP2_CANGL